MVEDNSEREDYRQYPYRPRLSIVISEEEHKRMNNCIPWGYSRRLFSILIDTVCTAVEEHGEMALAAIMTRRVNVLDIIPKAAQPKEGSNNGK